MGLKKEHHISDLFLFIPGILDHSNSLFTNPLHKTQLADVFFDKLKGLDAESAHDALGHDRADAFNHTRAEILLDAVDGGGNR